MLNVRPDITIPDGELELSYARSSGPGGQNVNKVNSKAVLRWNPARSTALPEHLRSRIVGKLQGKLTTDGDIVIMSDQYRDQGRNKDDCLNKLKEIILAACVVPKIRRKTKPTFGSQKRKAEGKRAQSDKKSMRRKPSW